MVSGGSKMGRARQGGNHEKISKLIEFVTDGSEKHQEVKARPPAYFDRVFVKSWFTERPERELAIPPVKRVKHGKTHP